MASRNHAGGLSTFIFIVLVATMGCSSGAREKRVLIMPREPSRDMEVALRQEYQVIADYVKRAGYKVVVATLSGRELRAGSLSLTPDLKLVDVRAKDYVGIVMLCSNAGTGLPISDEAKRIVKQAAARKLPIAAQRGSVLILAAAKLWNPDDCGIPKTDRLRGLGGTGIYQKGLILTSGICPMYSAEASLPDPSLEMAKRFISLVQANGN